MSAGSLQLRLYRIARRDGVSRQVAEAQASLLRGEGHLVDADDRRDPPAPECFALTPGMARLAVGALVDTPLGAAAVCRLARAQ